MSVSSLHLVFNFSDDLLELEVLAPQVPPLFVSLKLIWAFITKMAYYITSLKSKFLWVGIYLIFDIIRVPVGCRWYIPTSAGYVIAGITVALFLEDGLF